MSKITAPPTSTTHSSVHSIELQELQKTPINAWGEFQLSSSPKTGGYSVKAFIGTNFYDAPKLIKVIPTEQRKLRQAFHNTEVVLNFRNAMVVELLQEKVNIKKMDQIAVQMVDKGVDLDEVNWSTRTDGLQEKMPHVDCTVEEFQRTMEKNGSEKAAELLTDAEVMEKPALVTILTKLHAGLKTSLERDPDELRLARLKAEEQNLQAKIKHFASQSRSAADEKDVALNLALLKVTRAKIQLLEETLSRSGNATTTTTTTTTTATTTTTTITANPLVSTSQPQPQTATPVFKSELERMRDNNVKPNLRAYLADLNVKIKEHEAKQAEAATLKIAYDSGARKGTLEEKGAVTDAVLEQMAILKALKKAKADTEEAIKKNIGTTNWSSATPLTPRKKD